MVASNWFATAGGSPAAANTSPRLTSISSAERQRHGLPGERDLRIAVPRQDARHGAGAARRQYAQRIAAAHAAARDEAGEAAKIRVRPVDPLHRHAKRRVQSRIVHLHRL